MKKVRVSRSGITTFGLFGPEKWWAVSFGLSTIALLRDWRDAQAVARMAARGIYLGTNRRGPDA